MRLLSLAADVGSVVVGDEQRQSIWFITLICPKHLHVTTEKENLFKSEP